MNCIIIDDEELARKLLENYVGRLPHLNALGSFKNPVAALQVIQNQKVDLIFLDIQMIFPVQSKINKCICCVRQFLKE